jgi:hypothetical protein
MRCLELQKVRRYGVDSLAIEKQAAKQRQRCAICRTKVPGGRYNKWHVDHKHGTKKMRGLLCNNCNTGIGFLKESLHVLKNAIKYLEKE